MYLYARNLWLDIFSTFSGIYRVAKLLSDTIPRYYTRVMSHIYIYINAFYDICALNSLKVVGALIFFPYAGNRSLDIFPTFPEISSVAKLLSDISRISNGMSNLECLFLYWNV
jgi:hypothetical protein